MSYRRIEGVFPSCDEVHSIPYFVCTLEGVNPKGIIQILHGMGEYAARYEEGGTVQALVDGGYIVCASDHLGHGGAVNDPREYGDISDMNDLIEDARQLYMILRAKYRYLPYFMLGHSMGSFLLRDYISQYPSDLDGAILSGTSGGGDPSSAGKIVAKLFTLIGMGKKHAPIFQKIMNSHCNSRLTVNDGSPLAWIVSDQSILSSCIGNENYGFPFTYRGYAALFGLMKTINDEEYLAQTPRSVPLLLLSGEDDPVGGMGEGIKTLYSQLFDAGVDDLKMKLYPGARHEILNEACKEEVWTDILAWADEECENHIKDRTWNPLG